MRYFALSIIIIIFSFNISFAQEDDSFINVLVYADKLHVAEKVALYFQEQGINAMSTDNIDNLKSLEGIRVLLLIPVTSPAYPADVLLYLKTYVYSGGNIIGMHDVLFSQSVFSEIFGGQAGIAPNILSPELTISIRDRAYSQIMKGIPDSFIIANEEAFGTRYKPSVHRLFDLTYQTTKGVVKTFCAGWFNEYGKGRTFYFSPGHYEETRYNLNVLKILTNTTAWMLKNYTEKNPNSLTQQKPSIKNKTLNNLSIDDTYNLLSSLENPSINNNDYVQGKMDGSMIAKGDQSWALAGLLGPLGVITAFIYPQEPPINIFSGKSREYAYGFTESYRAECRNKNAGFALGGWVASWLILYLLMMSAS